MKFQQAIVAFHKLFCGTAGFFADSDYGGNPTTLIHLLFRDQLLIINIVFCEGNGAFNFKLLINLL